MRRVRGGVRRIVWLTMWTARAGVAVMGALILDAWMSPTFDLGGLGWLVWFMVALCAWTAGFTKHILTEGRAE